MKTDFQIQKDVMDELRWQPALQSAEIGVAVKDGVVTLSGKVDSYTKKMTAERVTKNVSGVKAIAEDIQVGLSSAFHRSDADIASAVLNALKWQAGLDEARIKVKVEDGTVKLEGETDWVYQRTLVENAVKNLTGVTGVINLIAIKQRPTPESLEQKIAAAFQRAAAIDAEKISVSLHDNEVTLRGTVRSLAEKEAAETTVWAAPGIWLVHNQLTVAEPAFAF